MVGCKVEGGVKPSGSAFSRGWAEAVGLHTQDYSRGIKLWPWPLSR